MQGIEDHNNELSRDRKQRALLTADCVVPSSVSVVRWHAHPFESEAHPEDIRDVGEQHHSCSARFAYAVAGAISKGAPRSSDIEVQRGNNQRTRYECITATASFAVYELASWVHCCVCSLNFNAGAAETPIH